eukprot:CAMPEP_0174275040 /NCGR_PEP_ID=MMETSP0439-20130205/59611_1 /TAXON_ID=0 /ORGANISM="Stereomyxa ramosa, Strain Chinc5" /LENGTH=350 /DNA_ID=CAMNT_0015367113 /DNA_START=66 /DNA_END=1118 /DNA_ORIENTATION=+
MNDFGVFEGPEKLLEVWFEPTGNYEVDGTGKHGLRSVELQEWEEMLKLVKCCILQQTSNEFVDAYLLSESSLYVWNAKMILKTCGTTTLLLAVPKLLEIANSVGLGMVTSVFYSRKRFLYPKEQGKLHGKWKNEVRFLDSLFDGSAYVMGKLNGEHWYLYTYHPGPLADSHQTDCTLEILMSGLNKEKVAPFIKSEEIPTAKKATEVSGIGSLVPSATVDDFLFDPCGYSVNGVLDSQYYTIHVTPQEVCSFASFETNIEQSNKPDRNYYPIIKKVLNIFEPEHFTVTLFTNYAVNATVLADNLDHHLENYQVDARTSHHFDTYDLFFLSMCRTEGAERPKPKMKKQINF